MSYCGVTEEEHTSSVTCFQLLVQQPVCAAAGQRWEWNQFLVSSTSVRDTQSPTFGKAISTFPAFEKKALGGVN